MNPQDDSCQNYETASTFVKVIQIKLFPSFFGHGVYYTLGI